MELAKDELCQLHERLIKLHPMAEPPTLFEFLHLDAYAFPFHPPEVGLHPESEGYEQAKSLIVQRGSEIASLWYEDKNVAWGKENERASRGSASSADSRYAAVISAVARALHNDDMRGVYIKKFLPVLTSYRWGRWGRREWEEERGGRLRSLEKFCKWKKL